MRADALKGGRRVRLRDDIPDDDMGAVLRQLARHGAAEVAGAAGHDCGLAFEHHVSSYWIAHLKVGRSE